MITDLDEALVHAGVKGMKWGVRKRTSSSENAAIKPLKKKKAKELTDAEIKQAISRMSLEKKYNELNPKGFSKANKIVLGALAVGVTVNTIMNFKNTAAGKAVVDGFKIAWDKASAVK